MFNNFTKKRNWLKAFIAVLLVAAFTLSMFESISYATENGQTDNASVTEQTTEAVNADNPEGYVASEKNLRNSETLIDMRGVWIAFVDYKNMGLYNKSEAVFRANASKMFKNLKKDKINTVFFHVVPCNDSIYPGKYLKWSKYMFKKAPAYDPLKILIELAHENDISFHAWLNPYRKTMKKSFNPGKDASVKRILNIVNEIIDNYDVDGIHMDDYFYPSNGQFKKVSVSKRKKNVNKMIQNNVRHQSGGYGDLCRVHWL